MFYRLNNSGGLCQKSDTEINQGSQTRHKSTITSLRTVLRYLISRYFFFPLIFFLAVLTSKEIADDRREEIKLMREKVKIVKKSHR